MIQLIKIISQIYLYLMIYHFKIKYDYPSGIVLRTHPCIIKINTENSSRTYGCWIWISRKEKHLWQGGGRFGIGETSSGERLWYVSGTYVEYVVILFVVKMLVYLLFIRMQKYGGVFGQTNYNFDDYFAHIFIIHLMHYFWRMNALKKSLNFIIWQIRLKLIALNWKELIKRRNGRLVREGSWEISPALKTFMR